MTKSKTENNMLNTRKQHVKSLHEQAQPTKESKGWEDIDPFEAFVEKCVRFDSKGCSELKSLHGLAKLLKRFYKENMIPELEKVRAEGYKAGYKDNSGAFDKEIKELNRLLDNYDEIRNKALDEALDKSVKIKKHFVCENCGEDNEVVVMAPSPSPTKTSYQIVKQNEKNNLKR